MNHNVYFADNDFRRVLGFIQALTVISLRLSAKLPSSIYEVLPLKLSAPPILPCVGDVDVLMLMS